MEEEIWKDIPGYEGEYQASTLGRIKSLRRKVNGKNPYTNQPFLRTVPECILKPGRFTKCGHVSVVLRHKANGSPVHQLVMRTFIGDPPEHTEVRHINGCASDNRLSNLCYGTRVENILDVYAQGKIWRKLSTEDVGAIRFGLWCGFLGAELSRMFHVSQSLIGKIKHGEVYAWLK